MSACIPVPVIGTLLTTTCLIAKHSGVLVSNNGADAGDEKQVLRSRIRLSVLQSHYSPESGQLFTVAWFYVLRGRDSATTLL